LRPPLPSLREIEELPVLLRRTLPGEWQDLNGHVNVQHYVHLYDLAGTPFLASLGIDEELVKRRRRGWFELEHHIWYLREMHVGDEVTLHCRLVGRNVKRLHGVMFVANQTRRELASVLEFVSSSADLDTRSTAPIPEDIAVRIDARIELERRFSWPVPTCGAMGV
jgi:acyl-CoA thioester hydrolase